MHDELQASLKTMSIGGGGGNTVYHMLKDGYQDRGLSFIVANTDKQALQEAGEHALVIGENLTKGLGAGAKPEIGRQAAEESEGEIRKRLEGTDMLFLTAGMGGGTGTGAIPVVARIARDMGILTVAIVTLPFGFEGPKRRRLADEGVAALSEVVDSLITIPNDKLLSVMGKNASLLTAFAAVNDVLRDAVLGISDMITSPGMINVDFADVHTVMSNKGIAKIGTGEASGDNRAEEAALKAINSPLLEDIEVVGAQGLLVNITAGPGISIGEFNTVGETLRAFVGDDATVVVGTSLDMNRGEELRVSVVATGLAPQPGKQPASSPSKATTTSVLRDRTPAAGKPSFLDTREHTPASNAPSEPTNTNRSQPTMADEDIHRVREQYREHNQAESAPVTERKHRKPNAPDIDYLDIPSFLRRSGKD